MKSALIYDYYLSRTGIIGPARYKILTKYFGSSEGVFKASQKNFQDAGLPPKMIERLIATRDLDLISEIEDLSNNGVKFLRISDSEYPTLLKEISDPPFLLYTRGELHPIDSECVALVGSRKYTEYGQSFAYKLASDLTEAGVTVVSGLAMGIDSSAHLGALTNGRTIGILGSGITKFTPVTTSHIARRIVSEGKGAVLSEFPPYASAQKHHFPFRNRLISGISKMVVVIEGTKKSGTMITVDSALKQGREVGAVPGDVTRPGSEGPLHLISQGAVMVRGVEDILNTISRPNVVIPKITPKLSGIESEIVSGLIQPMTEDDLVTTLARPIENVISALQNLQLMGVVSQSSEGNWTLAP